MIANIVVADALVLLTDVDALYTAPPSEPGSRRISYVPNVEDALAKVQVGGTGSNVGTGGMVTKMEAARVAAVSGIPAVLTCAANAGPAMMGDPVGTAFAPSRPWIITPPMDRVAAHPQGTLVPMPALPMRYAEGPPACLPPAYSKCGAILPPETRCGSTMKRAITSQKAS